jgi:hypothetical protein
MYEITFNPYFDNTFSVPINFLHCLQYVSVFVVRLSLVANSEYSFIFSHNLHCLCDSVSVNFLNTLPPRYPNTFSVMHNLHQEWIPDLLLLFFAN